MLHQCGCTPLVVLLVLLTVRANLEEGGVVAPHHNNINNINNINNNNNNNNSSNNNHNNNNNNTLPPACHPYDTQYSAFLRWPHRCGRTPAFHYDGSQHQFRNSSIIFCFFLWNHS